jgi:cytochrome c6
MVGKVAGVRSVWMAGLGNGLRILLVGCVCVGLIGLGWPKLGWAADLAPNFTLDLAQGAQVFETQCAGCHLGGGNIVRRGKNLKLKTLQRNHVDTMETIAALVQKGQGNMSAYRDRISPAEIENVAAYVLDQAQKGWK